MLAIVNKMLCKGQLQVGATLQLDLDWTLDTDSEVIERHDSVLHKPNVSYLKTAAMNFSTQRLEVSSKTNAARHLGGVLC